jgi:hypothetical protein
MAAFLLGATLRLRELIPSSVATKLKLHRLKPVVSSSSLFAVSSCEVETPQAKAWGV